MVEIEAKFKVEDLDLMRDKILKVGAERVGETSQIDTYFVHPVKEELKGCPTYLRIRTSGGKTSLAMHYKLEEYKWEELETVVQDGDIVREIYKNLGFEVDVEVEKKRETWKIPEGEIVIDTIKGLGAFMEIEVYSIWKLARYCDVFGLVLGEKDPLERKAYPDLLRELKSNEKKT